MKGAAIGIAFGVVALTLAIVFIGMVGMSLQYWTDSSKCDTLHKLAGVETNVTLNTGCLVKYNGAWVDAAVMTNHKIEVDAK